MFGTNTDEKKTSEKRGPALYCSKSYSIIHTHTHTHTFMYKMCLHTYTYVGICSSVAGCESTHNENNKFTVFSVTSFAEIKLKVVHNKTKKGKTRSGWKQGDKTVKAIKTRIQILTVKLKRKILETKNKHKVLNVLKMLSKNIVWDFFIYIYILKLLAHLAKYAVLLILAK